MSVIEDPDQPELPISDKIACVRCRGLGTVYYARTRADVIGGKRLTCPECGGGGRIDLSAQLFPYASATMPAVRRR